VLRRVVVDLPAPVHLVADLEIMEAERSGMIEAEEIEAVVLRQGRGRAEIRPVAGGLPVDRLPGVGRVVPLLAVADGRGPMGVVLPAGALR
jgi:hypothetical protein